jgi:hypothetical protein
MVVLMSKKPLLIVAVSFVLLVILITARAAYVYVKEQSEARQREEQLAKAQQAAQDAMKQWQQQMGAYSQMQQNVPNLANLPNMANMPNFSGMPGYSPASQMAMARLMQSGVGMGIASYLVQAKAQVLSQSNNSVRYSLTFPNGVYSESTVTINPNQHYSPSSAELAMAQKTGRHVFNVHLSSKKESDTKARITLTYFVPNSAIPANLQQRLQNKSAQRFSILPSVFADEGGPGVGIAQDTGIEIAKEILKEKAEDTKLAKEFPTPLSRLVDILNAFKKEQEHIGWLDEFNELQDCVENPTNPLTQKAYNENPAYKQQTLDNLAEAHSDVTQATAMRFLNLATSVATDLVDGPLGAITAPVSSYNDDALKGVAENRINDIKKSVTDCNPFKGYGDMYPPLHGKVEYLYNRTWHDGKDNGTRVHTEKRTLTAEVELGFDENGKNNSGVNGTGKYHMESQGKYTNPKGYAEDKSTIDGPVEVYAQLGGSGSVGWVQLSMGGQTMHGTTDHTDTFGSKPNISHSEWDNGGGGVTCKFTGVNLQKGGTYSSFVESDNGFGTCKIELTPK